MDKRDLSLLFKDRLRHVVASHSEGRGHFMKSTGIDRSALSQFLSPETDRLPRAETLRRIASVSGVSVDWLLCLENAPEGRQEFVSCRFLSSLRDSWRVRESGSMG